jgi:hypothetical protein
MEAGERSIISDYLIKLLIKSEDVSDAFIVEPYYADLSDWM